MPVLFDIRLVVVIIFSLALAWFDVRERIAPNWLNAAGFTAGLALAFPSGQIGIEAALLGAAGFGVPFLLMASFNAIGFGDAKAAAALGTLLWFPTCVPAMVLAIFIGGAYGILLVAIDTMQVDIHAVATTARNNGWGHALKSTRATLPSLRYQAPFTVFLGVASIASMAALRWLF